MSYGTLGKIRKKAYKSIKLLVSTMSKLNIQTESSLSYGALTSYLHGQVGGNDMKIHISSFALFFWGVMMLFAGLSNDVLMVCLAACGLCFALYWHISHLIPEKEYDTDIIRTYYLKDGTKLRAMTEKDFGIVSKSLFATLEQVEELQKEKAKLIKKWFKKGQMSVKRKNKSGCCCIINDDDEIESLCGAHDAYVKELRNLMDEADLDDWFIQNNSDFEKRWKKALGD